MGIGKLTDFEKKLIEKAKKELNGKQYLSKSK
jgi:hypothetical protein